MLIVSCIKSIAGAPVKNIIPYWICPEITF